MDRRTAAAVARAAEFDERFRHARTAIRLAERTAGRPLGWTEVAAVGSSGEPGDRSWRHTAASDVARFAAWLAQRADPDGWFRPSYAWWLASRIATGRRDIRGSWTSFANNPRQDRYGRRRMDALRRVGRMDPFARKVAQLYGWQARGGASSDPAPRWPVRRARLVYSFASAVARHTVRASAVPDAWTVAAAAADGIDTSPRPWSTYHRSERDRPASHPAGRARSSHTRTGGNPAADADGR